MAVIVTNANWLQVDGARLQKGKWDLALTAAGVRLSDAGQSVNIPYSGTTIDGSPVSDAEELFAFFESQGFKEGGGTGEGVQSVQEEGKGWPIKNYLPITQDDYDALTTKDPQTEYAIISEYPTP